MVAAAGSLACPCPGSAQDVLAADRAERRTDRARTLFRDGAAAAGEGRFTEAERLFREALELHDAPAIRYNLASVLVELGLYPEAREMALSLISGSDVPAELREHARELRAHVDAQAGFAQIVTDGETDVMVDGRRVRDLSESLYLSPGEHVATGVRREAEVARVTFEIVTGETRRVELLGEDPSDPPSDRDPELHEQWWFWAAIGGGAAVLIGIIAGVAVAASSPPGMESPIEGNFEPGVLRW